MLGCATGGGLDHMDDKQIEYELKRIEDWHDEDTSVPKNALNSAE